MISNVFSRLSTNNFDQKIKKIEFVKNELNVLFASIKKRVFNLLSVMKISTKFRNRIIKNYQIESIWIKIRNIIVKTLKNEIKISFHKNDDLIYFDKKQIINTIFHKRLCFFQIVLKKIFVSFMTNHISNFINVTKFFFCLLHTKFDIQFQNLFET